MKINISLFVLVVNSRLIELLERFIATETAYDSSEVR